MSSMYLSIDVDFWNRVRRGDKALASYLEELVYACGAKEVPLRAVTNHHQMLPLIDASGARTLINIDLHSDLADEYCEWFNCGSFISYVKWRREGHYHWIASGTLEDGECSHAMPIWGRHGSREWTDWGSIQRTARKTPPPLSSLPFSEVVAVGVCLSPGYSDPELQEVFHDWRRAYGVPYKRGRRDEYGMGVERSPSP